MQRGGWIMGNVDQPNGQNQPNDQIDEASDQIDEASRTLLKRVDQTGAYFRSLFARSMKLNLGGLFELNSGPRLSESGHEHGAAQNPPGQGALNDSKLANGLSSEKQATKDVDSG